MKKHLLLSMAALLGAATTASAAFEEGAIVQTPDGRSVRVTSENLLTNGDFSKGLEGWTGLTQELSEDTVKVVTDAFSPAEGVPYLQIMKTEGVKTSSLLGVASFRTSYELEGGKTYLFTYKGNLVLGGFSSNSSGSRSDNYQHVYINGDGTCFWPTETEENKNRASVSLNTKFPVGEWYTVNYIYQCDSTEWVNFDFKNLTQFDRFADFGVYECEEVGDARWAQEAVDAIQSILADKETFPGAVEYLQAPLDEVLAPLTNPEAAAEYDPEGLLGEIDAIMTGEDSPLTEYLNTISADVSGYFSENYFNYNDCAEKGYNKGAAEDWSETGGRWGVSGPWANLGTNHIFAEINASYALGAGSEYISAVLPAGKYLYMVNGSALQFIQSGTNDYFTRRNGDMGYFINADSIPMADVPNAWAKTYWHVFDVKEDGEQTVGFWRYESAKSSGSDRERTSGGGQVRFDNMHIRILGMTDAQVEQYFLDLNKKSSMATLKNLIDSANAVVALDKYNYGKRILRDSVAIAQAVYDQNIELKATQELIDEVNGRIDPMEDAIRDFYSRNELYVALATDIDEANGLYADENRKNGKDALMTAIDKAQAAYDGIQETDFTTAADSTAMIGAREALAAASEVYYFANAAYQTPAKVTIVNDDFSDGVNGWVEDGKTGNAAWQTNSAFDTKNNGDFGVIPMMYYNRGSSASDDKWVYQDVAISRTGAYDFHATLAVHNAGWATDANDSTNNSNTFMYVNTDSMMIVTPGVGRKEQTLGQFRHFNIPIEIKNLDAVPGTTIPAGYMRIGLVKQPLADGSSVKVNMIYFGAPTLYYYGSWEDYLTGIYDVENVELNSTFDVYNLNGMKVRSDATSLDGLAKGIYIVNGKKYVVK